METKTQEAATVPKSVGGARDRILWAAETEFAQHGFSGTGMKAVATSAEVAQGLIHYHFKDKEGLYEAVIEQRSALINAGRISELDKLDLSSPNALTEVFMAFFTPPLGQEGGGATFARIFGALAVGLQRDRVLVKRYYDPTAKRFIAAIKAAAHGASDADAAWGYLLALGSLVAVVGRDDRLDRLSNGNATLAENAALVRRLTAFAVGGMQGLIESNKRS